MEYKIPTCCGEVIKNVAAGNEFYVCKSCKQEVKEDSKTYAYSVSYASKPFVMNPALSTLRLPTAVPAQPTLYHGHEWDYNKLQCKNCVLSSKDINYAINNNINIPKCSIVSPRQSAAFPTTFFNP